MSRPWSQIKQIEGEKRLAWSTGDLVPIPHVIARGTAASFKEARALIEQARERGGEEPEAPLPRCLIGDGTSTRPTQQS